MLNFGNTENVMGMTGQMGSVMQLINVFKSGGNPMPLLQQMSQNNPELASALQMAQKMAQGKNTAEAIQTAKNILTERGINPDMVANQLGIKL